MYTETRLVEYASNVIFIFYWDYPQSVPDKRQILYVRDLLTLQSRLTAKVFSVCCFLMYFLHQLKHEKHLRQLCQFTAFEGEHLAGPHSV